MESTTLEVCIGLAVVFFLAASIVTATNEALTRLLNVRSKALWATLGTMLTPPPPPAPDGAKEVPDPRKQVNLGFITDSVFSRAGQRPSVASAPLPTEAAAAREGVSTDGARELLATPSVWSLDYAKSGHTKVWNIPTKVFTAALLELATIKGAGDSLKDKVEKLTDAYAGSPLARYLHTLPTDAATDIDKFTDQVGGWFDGQMSRLTDSYRRLTKYFLAAIGLVVAVTFNVDAIAIGGGLAANADQRQAVVLLADNLDPSGLPCPKTSKEKSDTKAGDNGDGVAGGFTALKCAATNLASIDNLDMRYPFKAWTKTYSGDTLSEWFAHLLGLMLTALAVALGGPFWFDTVGALAGLRRKQA